ncbi:uncharacterized, partial [Tachysurus ichikawai]
RRRDRAESEAGTGTRLLHAHADQRRGAFEKKIRDRVRIKEESTVLKSEQQGRGYRAIMRLAEEERRSVGQYLTITNH